jgi:hypothetical protein
MGNIFYFPVAVLVSMSLGAGAVLAQSAGPDEAVRSNGAIGRTLALTAGQIATVDNRSTAFLKYAMVANDVVMVDSIAMRVVIRNGAKP